MGLLDGQLAQAIYDGFKGKLLKGSLRREVIGDSSGLDELGDPVAAQPTTWGIQGFTDEYSDFFKAQAGIPTSDLKVCIFGKSLPAGVRPQKDDKVSFVQAGVSTWYQLRKATTDPATALWTCQGYVIPAPA